MTLLPTKISGCFRVSLEILRDSRGHFINVFDLEKLRATDPSFEVVRACRSRTSLKGAIRGLHFQRPPMAEHKLVQCLQGAVFDVCVDIRPDSPTHLQWVGTELNPLNQELMLVPKGCAHGFQTLHEDSVVEYFISQAYSPSHEGGVHWSDPAVGIEWPLPCSMTSPRDAAWPMLER